MPKNLMTPEEFQVLRDWVHQVAAIRADMASRPNDQSYQRARRRELDELDRTARSRLTDPGE